MAKEFDPRKTFRYIFLTRKGMTDADAVAFILEARRALELRTQLYKKINNREIDMVRGPAAGMSGLPGLHDN